MADKNNAGGSSNAGTAGDKGGAAGGDVDVSRGVLAGDVQTSGQQDDKGGKAGEGKGADGKELTPDQVKAAAEEKAKLEAAKAGDVAVKWGELKIDEKLGGKFNATAKELGLTSEKAQKIADLYVEARKQEKAADAAQLEQAISQQNKQWQEELRNDKEIGGKLWSKSVLDSNKALAKFGPELKKDLETYGLLSLPSLVRMLARVGKADDEDSLGEGAHGSGGKGAPTAADKLKARYPTMSNGR